VSYIAPSIDPRRGSVEVRLRVPDPPAQLKPNMTMSIDLMVAAKQAALAISSDAVRGASTPTPWVLTVEDGRARRRDVRLGIRGEGSVEIISGIDEASEVILSGGRPIEPGARVRAERD
jgi:HlyD family secretion protein